MNKLSKFQSFVYSNSYEIFCITETWLSESIFVEEIIPEKFVIYRKDRKSRGGGVLVAVKETIPTTLVPSPDNLEVITVSINSGLPITLCTIYIPPNSSDTYQSSLLSYLRDLINSNEHLVLVGDFNLPDIDWDTLTGTSAFSCAFCDFVFDSNLSQLVDKSTHTKGNLLDLVLTNSDELVHNLNISSTHHAMSSDHSIISFCLLLSIPAFPTEESRYVFDFPFQGLCEFLLDYNFSDCFNSNDVETVWSSIKHAIYLGMHLFIPKVRIRRRQFPVWTTPNLRHLLKCLKSLRRKCSRSPTPGNLTKLQALEERVQTEFSTSKALYEKNLIQSFAGKKDSKIYSYITSVTGNRTIPPTVFLDNTSASSDVERATLFNSYFHSVFTKSSFVLPSGELPVPDLVLNKISVSESEVFNALSSLDPSKAMGIDGIGPKILKHCAIAIFKQIHHLFCLSLSQQLIPDEWKCHLITPVHKSGDRSMVKNYRPISLLCVVSKVLERIVYDHTVGFIKNQISSLQFGFLRKRSSIQQLLIFLNIIHSSINSNSQCDVIYLDFGKAFDTVAHNELLVKLWSFGITGNLWNWFKVYLTGRRQSVAITNCCSEFLPVVSGVPQGSILGPLLFLVFINDILECTSDSSLLLFADDTKCLKPIYDPVDCSLLQSDLDKLSLWSKQWKLSFNESKCTLVTFHSKLPVIPHSYHINDQVIANCKQHKDLGVLMANDLSWSAHLQFITARAYKMLGLLRRSFSSSGSSSAMKSLYLSLVRSRVIYCSQVWRPFLLKDINILENVQRRATKFILNDFISDYKSRLLTLHLLPLTMMYELNDILFFIKSLKEPSDAFNVLDYVSFSCNATRSSTHTKLVHKFTKTNAAKHFYFSRLPRLWNSLPPIDLSLSYFCIKVKLRQFFGGYFVSAFNPSNPCSYHFLCPCHKCISTKGLNFSSKALT